MRRPEELKTRIFADGADLPAILQLYRNPLIKGFTTNPTLMRKAGISDYRVFAQTLLSAINDRPISFEVFADDFAEMERQALEIAGWGVNAVVKIPVTNTRGESSRDLIARLVQAGVCVNVTALLTVEQVKEVAPCLHDATAAYVSVFAGRIADTGRDPLPVMAEAVEALRLLPAVELIWASPREVLNLYHAESVGCHIITMTHDLLKKLVLIGKDLQEFSLETVQMFYDDGRTAGFSLEPARREEVAVSRIHRK